MSHNKIHPDLEPLIEAPNAAAAAKHNKWKFNRKVKLPGLIKRRDLKGYHEKWGRIRLGGILCAFAFLVIYLSNLKPYQHVVVRIPEDDLPGPKGS